MKEIRFEDWEEVLAQSQLPERQKGSWTITLRWYLSFCRRGRAGVTVQSARDFVAWAQEQKQAQPWQVERWKEAINWFFREAKAHLQIRTSNIQHPISNIQCGKAAKLTPHPEFQAPIGNWQPAIGNSPPPAWKSAFLTVVRRRGYSYRTEQSYLVWIQRFARFCRSDDLQTRGPEDIKGFLDELALNERLSASSQRQAFGLVEG
jgi:hypothetical protein